MAGEELMHRCAAYGYFFAWLAQHFDTLERDASESPDEHIGKAQASAPNAVTSTRGPCTDSFPAICSDDGVKFAGLKLVVESVPLMDAFPASLKFPPSVSPKAEMLFPRPVDDTSAGRNTSGKVVVPLICGAEICTW